MFKVVDRFDYEHTVYAVDRKYNTTYFLLYDGENWVWVLAETCRPVDDDDGFTFHTGPED